MLTIGNHIGNADLNISGVHYRDNRDKFVQLFTEYRSAGGKEFFKGTYLP